MAAMHCGIKSDQSTDLLLITLPKNAIVSGVFTQSQTAAAPIQWCRETLQNNRSIKALLINSGNANAGTGTSGLDAVNTTANTLGKALDINVRDILLSSTGIIGVPLPTNKITQAIPHLCRQLEEGFSWEKAARAIMTTDTYPKAASKQFTLNGKEITIVGIAKGAGMIMPNMATMLGYIFTDIAIEAAALDSVVQHCIEKTFNSISVDGDTSTNDTVLVCSTQDVKVNNNDTLEKVQIDQFQSALLSVMEMLATLIVKDAEGLSKFITIDVSGAASDSSAKNIASSIANSPLIKTAIAGSDPNWGRILMAIGKSQEPIQKNAISISIGDHSLMIDAEPCTHIPDDLYQYMQQREIHIAVKVGGGNGQARYWTSDLTHEYVNINADYPT